MGWDDEILKAENSMPEELKYYVREDGIRVFVQTKDDTPVIIIRPDATSTTMLTEEELPLEMRYRGPAYYKTTPTPRCPFFDDESDEELDDESDEELDDEKFDTMPYLDNHGDDSDHASSCREQTKGHELKSGETEEARDSRKRLSSATDLVSRIVRARLDDNEENVGAEEKTGEDTGGAKTGVEVKTAEEAGGENSGVAEETCNLRKRFSSADHESRSVRIRLDDHEEKSGVAEETRGEKWGGRACDSRKKF